MPSVVTKAGLTPTRKRLVKLMQEINYGRIEGLQIQNGEPMFKPPPKVVRKIKIGGENGPKTGFRSGDFSLKSKLTEFFEHLAAPGSGTISKIEVQGGLPFSIEIEESAGE